MKIDLKTVDEKTDEDENTRHEIRDIEMKVEIISLVSYADFRFRSHPGLLQPRCHHGSHAQSWVHTFLNYHHVSRY